MKRVVILCCIMIITLLTGCQESQKNLKLRQDSFEVELGNIIVKEPLCYLDVSDLSSYEINDIEEKSTISIDSMSSDQDKYDTKGKYQTEIIYENERVSFYINVVDTRQPTILGPNVLSIEKGKVHDYTQDYHCVYYGSADTLTFDTSKMNINQTGEYPMIISLSQNPTIQRHVTVKVENKVNNQLPSNIKLDIPYYNQLDADAPNGCEATALYMALQYKEKISLDLKTFIDDQPRSETPYEGFSGDPFSKTKKRGDYYTIFPQPLVQYGSQYADMRDISGSTLNEIKDELAYDHPVVVWVTGGFQNPTMGHYYFGRATRNLHIVLLNGYDEEKKIFYVLDPIDKQLTEISFEQFKICYDSMQYAICVN